MKRKIVKQGAGGSTIFLPAAWVRKQGLSAGDYVNVEEETGSLIVSSQKIQKKRKKTTIVIPDLSKSLVRTLLVNLYRAGYDEIIVQYKGPKETISKITHSFLLGFEAHPLGKDQYLLESLTEVEYSDFENAIGRQFLLLQETIKNVLEKDIEDMEHKIEKQENFLKRCISKTKLVTKLHSAMWRFLSTITFVARSALNLQGTLYSLPQFKKEKLNKIVKSLYEMTVTLSGMYYKKDVSLLGELYQKEQEIIYKKESFFKNLDPRITYNVRELARITFHAGSPLSAWIQANSEDKVLPQKRK